MNIFYPFNHRNHFALDVSLARIAGMNASALYSVLIEMSNETFEWFSAGVKSIESKLPLTKQQQTTAIKALRKINLIETKVDGMPRKRKIRILESGLLWLTNNLSSAGMPANTSVDCYQSIVASIPSMNSEKILNMPINLPNVCIAEHGVLHTYVPTATIANTITYVRAANINNSLCHEEMENNSEIPQNIAVLEKTVRERKEEKKEVKEEEEEERKESTKEKKEEGEEEANEVRTLIKQEKKDEKRENVSISKSSRKTKVTEQFALGILEEGKELTGLTLSHDSEAYRFSLWFRDNLLDGMKKEKVNESDLQNWAKCYLTLRKRGHEKMEIVYVCQWARQDDFWKTNFYTPCKLTRKSEKMGIWYMDKFVEEMRKAIDAGEYRV